ncbi:MAG: radical SAM protein, partial [Methanobacteriaceae archaeon]|nr:radical SAM protein [Methanobacteriaceae archaeon]
YPESHLVDYLSQNDFDVIAVSVIGGYYQYQKLLKISNAINSVPNRPYYILGGHGPSPEPEYFLQKTKADAIVIGEGEISTVNLLAALENNKDLSSVKGIAYRDNGTVFINEPQELIKDIDSIPHPAWDLFPMDYYTLLREPKIKNSERTFQVLSGRGCTFNCNFCYRMDKGFRPRSAQSIIEEIKILIEKYAVSYIEFTDDLFMSSIKRTKELCNAFIKADLNIHWNCNGRLNYAIPDVLKLMKEAGCVFINYGIESMDDTILKNMNKKLKTKQIIDGIEATLAEGISPGYNIIFGNIGENADTLRAGLEFLLKYDDHSQLRTIRPVTPYPGSPLYYYAIEKGLLKDVEDFYENKHLNSDLLSVNFTDLSDDEFHNLLFEANKTLLENYHKHQFEIQINTLKKLYFGKDVTSEALDKLKLL